MRLLLLRVAVKRLLPSRAAVVPPLQLRWWLPAMVVAARSVAATCSCLSACSPACCKQQLRLWQAAVAVALLLLRAVVLLPLLRAVAVRALRHLGLSDAAPMPRLRLPILRLRSRASVGSWLPARLFTAIEFECEFNAPSARERPLSRAGFLCTRVRPEATG